MWLEAILSKEDLTRLALQFAPLKVTFAGKGDLLLYEPGEVTLVPDVGVQIRCKATFHWPVLGITVPITAHSILAVVRPEVDQRAGGDALVFKLELREMDLAGIPAVIDRPLTEVMNEELGKKHLELAWNFFETLSHGFALPQLLAPLDAFELRVVAGGVKISADAMVLAVSFQSRVGRAAEAA